MINGIIKGIVIPCYNEAYRLKLEKFSSFINDNPEYMLCFVNDGSRDATLDQLLHFQENHPIQVCVVNLNTNQGKAEAVRSGIIYLLAETRVEEVGFLDADLATDFIDYKRLSTVLQSENRQMVVGSRKMNGGQEVKRSAFRMMASNIVGKAVSMIIALPIKDTQCGAKVFKRATAVNLFDNTFLSRWLFDVELFIRIRRFYGTAVMSKISEVGLLNWTEVEGSRISLRESLKFPFRLVEIAIAYNVKPQFYQLISSLKPSGRFSQKEA